MPQTLFAKLRGQPDAHSARVQDNIDAVVRPTVSALAVTPIMGAPPPAWVEASLVAPWVNVGAPFATTAFHRDALGYVHAKGVLKNNGAGASAAGATITTLPQGYRPAETQAFAVTGNGGAVQFITVAPTGVASATMAVAPAGVCYFSFSFLAEQ